jgi:hypothetical protein
MRPEDPAYLHHMLEAIGNIEEEASTKILG